MSRFVNNLVATFALDVTGAVNGAVEATVGQAGGLAAAVNYVRQEPGVGVEELRRAVGLSQPATVRLVNQLVADGLVERRAHGSDARRVHLHLTDAGVDLSRRLAAARLAAAGAFLDRLSGADRQALSDIIGRVYERRAPSRAGADHICRLCDLAACPEPRCPVDRAVDDDEDASRAVPSGRAAD